MATRFFRKHWTSKAFREFNFCGIHLFEAIGVSASSDSSEIIEIPVKAAHKLINKWNILANGEWIYRLDAPPQVE